MPKESSPGKTRVFGIARRRSRARWMARALRARGLGTGHTTARCSRTSASPLEQDSRELKRANKIAKSP
jgi:hypothetical protein